MRSRSRTWLSAANWFLVTGLAGLGVGLALPAGLLRSTGILTGVTLLLACLVALVMSAALAPRLTSWAGRFRPWEASRQRDGEIHVSWLDPTHPNEVSALLDLREELVPGGGTDRQLISERLTGRAELAKMIRVCRGGRLRLEGYTIVYPLSKSAVEDILTGEVTNGVMIRERQIVRRWNSAKGAYIGSAAGSSRAARISVVTSLQSLRDRPGVDWVFGRPTTKEALRGLARAGFAPIFDGAELWGVDMRADRRLEPPGKSSTTRGPDELSV